MSTDAEQSVKRPDVYRNGRPLTGRGRDRRIRAKGSGQQRKLSRQRTRVQRGEALAYDRKRAMYAVATGQVPEATEAAVRNARRAIEAVVLPQLEQLPEERRDAARAELVPWLQG